MLLEFIRFSTLFGSTKVLVMQPVRRQRMTSGSARGGDDHDEDQMNAIDVIALRATQYV
eukprot:SAG11_NODE_1145_length_5693_cov_23.401323_4_plen_59_part_00